MIQIISGRKGKGKTKELLDKVNSEVKTAHGNIVYLDKNSKHMYELNNKVRLINVCDYDLTNSCEFVGFIYGILSQDNDLEQLYLDSFLKIANLEDADVAKTLEQLDKVSEKHQISITISISLDEHELPETMKDRVIISL